MEERYEEFGGNTNKEANGQNIAPPPSEEEVEADDHPYSDDDGKDNLKDETLPNKKNSDKSTDSLDNNKNNGLLGRIRGLIASFGNWIVSKVQSFIFNDQEGFGFKMAANKLSLQQEANSIKQKNNDLKKREKELNIREKELDGSLTPHADVILDSFRNRHFKNIKQEELLELKDKIEDDLTNAFTNVYADLYKQIGIAKNHEILYRDALDTKDEELIKEVRVNLKKSAEDVLKALEKIKKINDRSIDKLKEIKTTFTEQGIKLKLPYVGTIDSTAKDAAFSESTLKDFENLKDGYRGYYIGMLDKLSKEIVKIDKAVKSQKLSEELTDKGVENEIKKDEAQETTIKDIADKLNQMEITEVKEDIMKESLNTENKEQINENERANKEDTSEKKHKYPDTMPYVGYKGGIDPKFEEFVSKLDIKDPPKRSPEEIKELKMEAWKREMSTGNINCSFEEFMAVPYGGIDAPADYQKIMDEYDSQIALTGEELEVVTDIVNDMNSGKITREEGQKLVTEMEDKAHDRFDVDAYLEQREKYLSTNDDLSL